MKIKEIYYSAHFARAFKKVSQDIQKQALKKEQIFRQNCFEESLKCHKLQGSLGNFWSFSVNYEYRILFEFLGEGKVAFVDIGGHEIYRK